MSAPDLRSLTTDLVLAPRLLVSVRSAEEAEAALIGGADWIDLKEPSAGPLAAVGVEVAKQVVDCVAGRRPISAALGELIEWLDSPAQQLLEVEGISVVNRVRLAKPLARGCQDRRRVWQKLGGGRICRLATGQSTLFPRSDRLCSSDGWPVLADRYF